MAIATFDTLKFANSLKAAGVPAPQAEAEAAAIAEAMQVNLKDLPTKDELKAELKALEDRLNSRFDLLKWMGGLILAACAAILVRLFFFRLPM